MARPLTLAEKVYDPDNDLTHYVADAPVDCRACISIVRYVQGCTFDALEPLRNGKN